MAWTSDIEAAIAGDIAAADRIDLEIDRTRRNTTDGSVNRLVVPIATAAAAGDRRALDLLMHLVDSNWLAHDHLRHWIPPHELEAAVQRSLWRVAKAIVRYKGGFLEWMNGFTYLVMIEWRNQDPIRPRLTVFDTVATGYPGLRRFNSMVASPVDLETAVSALPGHLRQVLTMRENDWLTYDEIADRLGMDLGTVKARLTRARAKAAANLGSPLGEKVGRYRIVETLDATQFVTVFAAHDDDLGTDVAVRVLATGSAGRPEIRSRFVDEAMMLRDHANPSLVAIHEIGETEDGRPYCVTERTDGVTLDDRLAAGIPATDTDIMRIVESLVVALGNVHETGAAHRDISPENLFLRGGERSDVELVGSLEELVLGYPGMAGDPSLPREMTLSAGTMYSAPEVRHPAGVATPASDIYAASALLCVILTGALPFEGKVGHKQPRKAHRALARAVERGLSERPSRRPETIEAWGRVITAALAATSPSRTQR